MKLHSISFFEFCFIISGFPFGASFSSTFWRAQDEVLHSASIDLPGASPCIRGPVAFFAVMDGHGGSKAAQYTRDHLQTLVLAHLCRPDATVAGALAAAFEAVDAAFMSSAHSDTSGTTCVAMLIELPTGQCWVANAGDSRCIVARGADAVALSVDHKADRPDEVQRIIGAGGMAIYSRRILRVVVLSVRVFIHAYAVDVSSLWSVQALSLTVASLASWPFRARSAIPISRLVANS